MTRLRANSPRSLIWIPEGSVISASHGAEGAAVALFLRLQGGTAVDAAIDADQWMRCLALEGLCGIGDGYGFPSGNPHNINFYAPPGGGKMLLVPWDWNFPFYNATDSSLFPTTHNISVVAARPCLACPSS